MPQRSSMPTRDENLVSSVLQEYGDATRAVLFDYLPTAEPRRYLYDLVADYPRRGGRAFRPSLCIATARAFGARLEAALRTAVSIELMHNAMLIHDDIEDESEQRRGQPTLHVTEGVPIAINVGDMLSLLAMRPLLDNRDLLGPDSALRILEETERMARESAEGQALELGWRRDNVIDVAEADYLADGAEEDVLARDDPPAAASAPSSASRGTLDLDRCIRFGFFLGAAFQIQDDLLNLEGDAKAYGKELDGDIREGQAHADADPPASRRRQRPSATGFGPMLGRPRDERSDEDVAGCASGWMPTAASTTRARSPTGWRAPRTTSSRGLYGHLPDSRDKRFIEALPDVGHRAQLSRWRPGSNDARRVHETLPPFANDPARSKPPFAFKNLSVRVFPLRANLDALQQLCDGYLNIVPPEVGRFRAVAPYAYLVMLDYGQISEIEMESSSDGSRRRRCISAYPSSGIRSSTAGGCSATGR